MILKIKFISDEVEGFLREFEIDSDATFLDLNKAILASCNYPDDQMTSFYLCDEEWERGQQVTREDMGASSADEDVYVMENTHLSEFLEDEGQRLVFVFDPFSDRMFYATVCEEIPGTNLSEPKLVRSKGTAPQQIAELDFSMPTPKTATAGAGEVEDDVLFGAEGPQFNDDELDLEGFEISDGQPY